MGQFLGQIRELVIPIWIFLLFFNFDRKMFVSFLVCFYKLNTPV